MKMLEVNMQSHANAHAFDDSSNCLCTRTGARQLTI